jgi:hypothetical protein
MPWTRNSPTRDGWYWWRLDENHPATVVHVSVAGVAAFTARAFDEPGEWWSERIVSPEEDPRP